MQTGGQVVACSLRPLRKRIRRDGGWWRPRVGRTDRAAGGRLCEQEAEADFVVLQLAAGLLLLLLAATASRKVCYCTIGIHYSGVNFSFEKLTSLPSGNLAPRMHGSIGMWEQMSAHRIERVVGLAGRKQTVDARVVLKCEY
jgi:hypothetical protein